MTNILTGQFSVSLVLTEFLIFAPNAEILLLITCVENKNQEFASRISSLLVFTMYEVFCNNHYYRSYGQIKIDEKVVKPGSLPIYFILMPKIISLLLREN